MYVHARLAGAPIGVLHLIGMRLRKVKLHERVYAHIRLHKAGLNNAGRGIPSHALETHCLAGGNLAGVVTAMIGAGGARVPLTWEDATAIDLWGVDPSTLVRAVVDARDAGYKLEWFDAAQVKRAGHDPAAAIRERIGAPQAPCPLCGAVSAGPAAARR